MTLKQSSVWNSQEQDLLITLLNSIQLNPTYFEASEGETDEGDPYFALNSADGELLLLVGRIGEDVFFLDQGRKGKSIEANSFHELIEKTQILN